MSKSAATSNSRPLPVCAIIVIVLLSFGVIVSIVGSIVMPMVFNSIISNIIEEIMVITPSSELFAGWKDPTMPIYQSFYFFDVQNKAEIMSGAKPRVSEVGPYTYMVNLTRENVTFNGNDTVSYLQNMCYTFVPEMSVGPEDDVITTVNIPLMTSSIHTKYESWWARLSISAIGQIHNQEILTRISIRDLLWGYQDPVLSQLQTMIGKDVITTDMFGLLLGQNGSKPNEFTINTGAGNSSLLNQIVEWNGVSSLSWWGDAQANMINGTDGTMFYPGVDKDDVLYVFSPFTFRSLPFIYQNDTSYQDMPLYHYYVPPYAYANPSEYPPNAGFCLQDALSCMPTGILNISSCSQGVPMSLSHPHFLYGDEEIINSIDGLEPNESLHQNCMDIEPIMGVPFLIHQRAQINVYVEEIDGIRQTYGLKPLHFPMLWIETNGVLPDSIISEYKYGLSLGIEIGRISRYSCIGVGISCLMIAILIFKCCRKKSPRKQDKQKQLKASNHEYISIPDVKRTEDVPNGATKTNAV